MTDNNNLSNSISLFSDPTTSEDMGTIQSKFNEFNKSNKSPKKKVRQEPSSSNKREEYRIEEGRRFHNDENAKYFLPNDDKEVDRLRMQHLMIKHAWQSNYSAPIDDSLKRKNAKVLDLG